MTLVPIDRTVPREGMIVRLNHNDGTIARFRVVNPRVIQLDAGSLPQFTYRWKVEMQSLDDPYWRPWWYWHQGAWWRDDTVAYVEMPLCPKGAQDEEVDENPG